MKYFFILGNNPTLSIAEILAVFGENKDIFLNSGILIRGTIKEINTRKIIKKLGGTIKIGEIIGESSGGQEQILRKITGSLKPGEGKFKFGISYYGKGKFNIKPLGMEIKKYLKEKGASCRWVTSRDPVLSSVVVEQNKLTDKGIEIVLIQENSKILIGKTLSVQPFKELSFRDYGRPARDDRSGMLPPKLAQIMINLSGAAMQRSAVILDPFCGSGTILTEAMLMGYENVIGADISKKAIEDTEKNIKWTKENFECRISNVKLLNRSVLELSKFIKPNSVDAIITEPYLGPQRGKVDFKKITVELENLYSKSLAEFKKILKSNGRVVMIFPVFQKSRASQILFPNLNGFKIINPIQKNVQNNKFINLTNRNTIVYGREGQKVWREIVVLEKI